MTQPPAADPARDALLPRLQSAAAAVAGSFGEAVRIPPFVGMFHPTDAHLYRNQALLDADPADVSPADVETAVVRIIEEFRRRHRHPRFELNEALWPDLAGLLERHNLRRQATLPIMVCTAAELRPFDPAEIRLAWLSPSDDRGRLRETLTVQRRAFEPGGQEAATDTDIDEMIGQLRSGDLRIVAATIDGRVVGAGALSGSGDIAELAGVGTDAAFRGRGVARAVSLFLAKAHLDAGGTAVWLTAGDDTARRVYERIGFRTIGTQLHYVDAACVG
jgi:ribosomal protein S18 acetylase RimI-like enzyme